MIDVALEDRIHQRLISLPLRSKPLQYLGVEAQCNLLFRLGQSHGNRIIPPWIRPRGLRVGRAPAAGLFIAHVMIGPTFAGGAFCRQLLSRIAFDIL